MSTTACPYCGMFHISRCPSVKAFEYYPDGQLKRVEFVGPQPIGTSAIPVTLGWFHPGAPGGPAHPNQPQGTET